MSRIMREALVVWLKAQDEGAMIKARTKLDEDEGVRSRSRDIGRILKAIFTLDPNIDHAALEDMAIDYLVVAHHPDISEDAQTSWIGLVQSSGLDPAKIAVDHQDTIMKLLWDAASAPPQVRRQAYLKAEFCRMPVWLKQHIALRRRLLLSVLRFTWKRL